MTYMDTFNRRRQEAFTALSNAVAGVVGNGDPITVSAIWAGLEDQGYRVHAKRVPHKPRGKAKFFLTPAIVKRILAIYDADPSKHVQEIAVEAKTTVGRVSETLEEYRPNNS